MRLLPTRAELIEDFATPKDDLVAGLTVALVALPLALAFGVASGLGAESGIITAILAGVIAGMINGFIVTTLRVNPTIATLGTLAAFGGVAFLLAPDGKPIGVLTRQDLLGFLAT